MTRWAASALVIGLLGGGAHAEVEPWKQGVTPQQMATAKTLLDAGNVLLLEHEYAPALAKYEEAVKAWNHPAIRFNMVRCLIQLGRLVEASENLELALKYGAAPLEETVYNEALAYQKLLANQIAEVTVACEQPDVELTFDGQPLMGCPGNTKQRVLPGRHQVVGKRAGYLTRTTELVVLGGQPEHVKVALDPFVRSMTVTHRWRTWIPWTVFGSGFAIAGIGGIIELASLGTRDEYNDRIAHDCASTPCDADYLSGVKDRALLENHIAIGTIAVGAGVVATGAVMLYLNRGREEYSNERATAIVTPTADGAQFVVRGRF